MCKIYRSLPVDRSLRPEAFTRLELLIVLAILLVLGALFAPVRAVPRTAGQGLVCLNNLRQLQLAWQLYAGENGDTLVMNYHGGWEQGGIVGLSPGTAPWAAGWEDWSTSPDNTNTLFLADARYSKLA